MIDLWLVIPLALQRSLKAGGRRAPFRSRPADWNKALCGPFSRRKLRSATGIKNESTNSAGDFDKFGREHNARWISSWIAWPGEPNKNFTANILLPVRIGFSPLSLSTLYLHFPLVCCPSRMTNHHRMTERWWIALFNEIFIVYFERYVRNAKQLRSRFLHVR